jgi:hypothetical protein
MELQDLQTFTTAYLEAALFTESVEEAHAAMLDTTYDASLASVGFTVADIDSSGRANANASCESFVRANLADLASYDAREAGHLFWLTRNGHGSGFWEMPGDAPCRLTRSAHAFGETHLYIGDGRPGGALTLFLSA